MVAVGERIDGVRGAAERDRPPRPPALLEVARDLIEAHARRMRVAVGGARGFPAHVEAVRAVVVAQAKALEGDLPVDAEPAQLELPRNRGRNGRVLVDERVDDRAPVREKHEEVRLPLVRQ